MKAVDDVNMKRSGCATEMLWVNKDKGYGQQEWEAKIPRDSYLAETVKPYVFDMTECHGKNKLLHLKVFLKDNWKQL